MKLIFRETDLREAIQKDIFPTAPEEVTDHSLDQIILGQLIKVEGEKTIRDCVLTSNEQGLLVVFMHPIKIGQAVSYDHLKFEEIQGIKVKEGLLFHSFTLQFLDGRNYSFRVQKRNFKHLPNQAENARRLIDQLYGLNLRDMDNATFKEKKKERRRMNFFYTTTLFMALAIAMFFGVTRTGDNALLFIVLIIAATVAHFFVFSFAGFLIASLHARPFLNEYNLIMKAYQENEDASQMMASLENIKHKPKTQDAKNVYFLSLSTAYFHQDQLDKAYECLEKIHTTDTEFLEIVEQQRADFEKSCDKVVE